jgi:hypothetical protein
MNLYADALELISDMQVVQRQIEQRVEELTIEDNDFLRNYEEFTYCSTA